MDASVLQSLDEVWKGTPTATLENGTLDFKTVGRSTEDTLKNLAEAAMCFANALGGTLVVGVRDDRSGPEAFVGSTLDTTQTVGRIYELTEPGLIVIATTEVYRGVSLTAITVPRSPDVHQVERQSASARLAVRCRQRGSQPSCRIAEVTIGQQRIPAFPRTM